MIQETSAMTHESVYRFGHPAGMPCTLIELEATTKGLRRIERAKTARDLQKHSFWMQHARWTSLQDWRHRTQTLARVPGTSTNARRLQPKLPGTKQAPKHCCSLEPPPEAARCSPSPYCPKSKEHRRRPGRRKATPRSGCLDDDEHLASVLTRGESRLFTDPLANLRRTQPYL